MEEAGGDTRNKISFVSLLKFSEEEAPGTSFGPLSDGHLRREGSVFKVNDGEGGFNLCQRGLTTRGGCCRQEMAG